MDWAQYGAVQYVVQYGDVQYSEEQYSTGSGQQVVQQMHFQADIRMLLQRCMLMPMV